MKESQAKAQAGIWLVLAGKRCNDYDYDYVMIIMITM